MRRTFALVVFFAVVIAGTGIAAAPGFDSSLRGEKVPVIIAFIHQPGPAEEALVRGASGTIKYTYHLVPAIAASLPEAAINGLLANPNVTSVDLDGQVWAIDAELDNAWGVKRIGAGMAHDNGNKGAGVRVAIVDSGVDYAHPDLNDNFVSNLGYDFVENDDDPMDVYGHGTHVAGTACAEDNGFGVVGIAPECALYSLRVLNDSGSGSWSDIIAAMQWAIDNGMQVANLSLGSSINPGGTVKDAFDNAEAAGLLIVAAAGNSGNPRGKGNSVIYPAKYDSVIAVAATDSGDTRANFSSTGDQVELAAPGVAVYSTWNDSDSPHDPQPVCNDDYGCYKYGSGTSMASPHVAGAAALVIASGITDANNNDRINDEVRQRLDETADDLGAVGRDPQYGYGLVDADEAASPPQPLTDIAITAVDAPGSVVQGVVIDVSVTAENVGNQDVPVNIEVTLKDNISGSTIGTKTIVGGLEVGVSTTLIFFWDTAGATLGDHILTASHDLSDGDVTNNTKSTTVTVSEPTSGITVTGIEPNNAQAGSTINITITGSGYLAGADVAFENGAGPAPAASNVVVVDANTITATVTAKSGGPPRDRVWDLRVTNPDGSTDALVASFTVTP